MKKYANSLTHDTDMNFNKTILRLLLPFLPAAIVIALTIFIRMPAGDDTPVIGEISQPPAFAAKPASTFWPRRINPLHVVVVFTKFKGEAPGENTPPSWAGEMFNGQIGTINDYFRAVSFGSIKVTGSFYPKLYELPYDTTYYKTSDIYTRDVLRILDEDPSFSFADCDNDGPDEIPNSGDDDGYVDYIMLMPRSRPNNFIFKLATGIMNLSLTDDFNTRDRKWGGGVIKADKFSGCIVVAQTRAAAIGIGIAEISHAYGAVDLMDKVYETPETDSAGVGYWCMLGWGATGWNGNGISTGPCAYNRMLMNCIGINNVNLTDIYGIHQGIRMKDVGEPDGKVYRLWIKSDEYFLIEYRNNEGSLFYDTPLPKSGLLIWHVNERESNSTEESKLCDLECPDGRFTDAGYPLGKFPDPIAGRDNLDYWSHDRQYMLTHGGNLGDATDVYDGVVYKTFGVKTNPNTNSEGNNLPTGIEIYNIRKVGNEMLFDCFIPPIPDKHPLQAPSAGLAYQRSNGVGLEQYVDFRRNVYFVNFGLSIRPTMLVTVFRDSMYAVDITSLSQYEIQKALKSGLSGAEDLDQAVIRRETVPNEEFERILGEFGTEPEDIGGGNSLRWVQKAVLEQSGQELPFLVNMEQNYPNPFNGETTIPYTLSKNSRVTLEVFNILGQKVLSLDQGFRSRGTHTVRLSTGDISSGVYFYRIRGSSISNTRRFVILR